MIRGLLLGLCLLAVIALYTWQGGSLLGERVEPSRIPPSIESVETVRDSRGLSLNVTVHNKELYHLIAVVDCEPFEDGESSACAAASTPLLSPGGRSTVRLFFAESSILVEAVTVRVRESIENVDPSNRDFLRISPTDRLRVELR